MKQIIRRVETKSFTFIEWNLVFLRQSICNTEDRNPWKEINVEIYRRILRNEQFSKLNFNVDFNLYCETMMSFQKREGNLLQKNDKWYVWNPHTYIYI